MVTTVEQLLAGLGSGIESETGVCGGDPRISNTRISVWMLEQYLRLGMSEAQILAAYPTLRAADLVNLGLCRRTPLDPSSARCLGNEPS